MTLPRLRYGLVLGPALLCTWPHATMLRAYASSSQDRPQAEAVHESAGKESHTPAQQKINSQLRKAIRQHQEESSRQGPPSQPVKLRRDAQGRVLVDIRAIVSQQLKSRIEKLGGKVVITDERYQSTLAYLPLESLEELAACSQVRFIVPAAESATH